MASVTAVHVPPCKQLRVYFHQLGRWHICPTMREGHINLWGEVEEKVRHLSMWQDCLPYYGTGGFSASLLGVRKFIWICVSSLLQKNFEFSLMQNYWQSMLHASGKTDLFEVERSCFGMTCWVVVVQWMVLSCWCLAVWCCVSGTAVGQHVYCALL